MGTPPTFFTDYEPASWFGTSSPVTVASVSAAVGDVLAAYMIEYSRTATFTFANTGTAQTWTKQTLTGGVDFNDTFLQTATTTVANVLSGVNVTVSRTGGSTAGFGAGVARFSGSEGIGASAASTGASTTTPRS
jgi:hypothetical protein